MTKEFKDPNNWIKHGIMGIVFMQIFKYTCYLSDYYKAKTIPFNLTADLWNESHPEKFYFGAFVGGCVGSMIAVSLMALFVEWLETKVDEDADISVPDIIITGLMGGFWYITPLGSNLTITILLALTGVFCGVWLFYKDKMFKK